MIMGTVVNSVSIVAGGALGLIIAKVGFKDAENSTIADGIAKVLGLAVVMLGVKMALEEHEYLSVVVCLALGTLIGELMRLEERMNKAGEWLKKISGSSSDTFVTGFVTASILFCVGATAIVGALKDGLSNDPSLLYVKSLLDGVMSVIFASTLGIGVLFSALAVFIYQGAISLASSQLSVLMENPIYINGISVAGGVLIIGIGLNLMQLTKLRILNMLPAIFLVPLYDVIYVNFIV